MPKEIQNSICSFFDKFRKLVYSDRDFKKSEYRDMEEYLWLYFLNERYDSFWEGSCYKTVATEVIMSDRAWHAKLDMLELAIGYLRSIFINDGIRNLFLNSIITFLNNEFERHNYAYRIVDDKVVEITSEEEIKAIEFAIQYSEDNVSQHLKKALSAYSIRPRGDYTNSIKESISAVEAYCREITGEKSLGQALKKLEIGLPKVLQDGFEKLYAYTNQPTTGIRHALMDSDSVYIPGNEEARYLLITCSAFLNYLRAKVNQEK